MPEDFDYQNKAKEHKRRLVSAFLSAPLRIAGSLSLGILLLAVLLTVLAWGTFVESEYGGTVAKFVLYSTNWFSAIIALLCLNILCAVVVRFPWGTYHIPFLLAHCGLLVLFYGCYQTWHYGEEAQITLPEGSVGRMATKTDQQQLQFSYIEHQFADTPQPVQVPFFPGPFNWQDYEYENWFRNEPKFKTSLWYALQLARRDQGKIPLVGKNVKVEVLDYLANSALESVPPLELNILWKQMVKTKTEFGEETEVPRNWEPVRLEMRQQVPGMSSMQGASAAMSKDERVSFFAAASQDELTAFQAGLPKGGKFSGFWGELVFCYGGKNYSLNVDSLVTLPSGNERVPLGGSGLEIGEIRFRERGPIINFAVFAPGGTKESMTLFPDNPEMNVQARKTGVFASYWLEPQKMLKNSDYSSNPLLQRLAKPRFDFVQGPDKKLYYRLWSGERIVIGGVVPDAVGGKKPEFAVAEGTPLAAAVSVTRFVAQDTAGGRIVSLPAGQGREHHQGTEKRVKLRVEFDGKEDTFWLRAVTPTVVPLPPESDQIRYLYGKNRTLCVQWDFAKIDLGFAVLLKKFEQRTEPGTKMPSHFSSLVDFSEPVDPGNLTQAFSRRSTDYRPLPDGKDILISMNRPAYFKGLGSGYRIYQSSYMGPYHPNQPQFFELYDGTIFPWEDKPRESVSMSTLSVNNDPGRGWKYFGCLLIVTGTAGFVWRRRRS
ncbi:MAG: cytochrome c biogenesis protein ResB [Planctomycetaceae bacterium]|jgi:hypothetical protein|nr:cytochrome c biogenesis protein ResB [Planctomycetaceae bacterium]